jgi:LDH2 family malate/lactate/ureidoglycolate dehydrogenase
VRLPGQRGLALKREQLQRGVALHEDVVPTLVPWADKLNVRLPEAL